MPGVTGFCKEVSVVLITKLGGEVSVNGKINAKIWQGQRFAGLDEVEKCLHAIL